MGSRGALPIALLLAVWPGVLAAPLPAQTTGSISGRAVDADGGALAGVVIHLRGAALVRERTAISRADGRFFLPALSPGTYRLEAHGEGFATLEQTDLRVEVDHTVVVRLQLYPGEPDEVMVTGAPPVVNLTHTASGASFSAAILDDLPLGRTAAAALSLVPGAVPTSSPGASGVGGALPRENRWWVDGVEATDLIGPLDPIGGDLDFAGGALPLELVGEIEIETGGYGPRHGGGPGAVVDVVTRAGGEALAGGAFFHFSPAAGARPGSAAARDAGFSLGGSLPGRPVRFFVGADRGHADGSAPGELAGALGTVGALDTEARLTTWLARLDASPAPGHHLSVSSLGVRETAPRDDEAHHLALGYGGVLTPTWSAELAAGRHRRSAHPVSPADPPAGRRESEEARGSVIGFGALGGAGGAGAVGHELHLGADYRYLAVGEGGRGEPPGVSGLSASQRRRSLYAEDRLRLGERLVVTLGLRADEIDARGGPQPAQPSEIRRSAAGFGETLSPRLGLAWDTGGAGRSKLYASAGRFISPPAGILVPVTAEPTRTDEAQLGFDHELLPHLWYTLRGVVRKARSDAPELVSEGLGERRYRAFVATVNKRLRNGWQLFASYVLAKSEARVAVAGAAGAVGEGEWVSLAGDRRHQVKLYGSYLWPSKLTTGFVAESFSGLPREATGDGHTPVLWHLDLHLGYPVELRSGLTLDLAADLTNLTDQGKAILVPPGSPLAEGSPAGAPVLQPPRRLRLGARLSW